MRRPSIKSALSDNDATNRIDQAEKAARHIGDRIKDALRGRDWAWLSRETGISTSTLSDYARGKVPRADKAVQIAVALGVSVEWLLTERESRRTHLIDAADADWVEVERFDLRNLNDSDKGPPIEQLPFRRDWLHRRLHRSSGFWMAELPSDYEALSLVEGDMVICSDIVPGDGPRDGWACIFRSPTGLFIARYSEGDGLIRAGDRVGEVYVTAAHLRSGEIRPVARIHAQLLARL